MKAKKNGYAIEARVMTTLLEHGLAVSTPWGDDEPYDLIADINGKLIRIQVKASRTRSNGESFSFNSTRNRYIGVGKYKHVTYKSGETDYFATVWKNKVYLVPAEECGQEKQLRIAPTRNGQRTYVNWASEYELERVLDKLRTTDL